MGDSNGKHEDIVKRNLTEDEDGIEDKSESNTQEENGKDESKSRDSSVEGDDKGNVSEDRSVKEAADTDIKKKDESITVKRNYRSNREDSTDSDADFKRARRKSHDHGQDQKR